MDKKSTRELDGVSNIWKWYVGDRERLTVTKDG
jgi:hypothetical protein